MEDKDEQGFSLFLTDWHSRLHSRCKYVLLDTGGNKRRCRVDFIGLLHREIPAIAIVLEQMLFGF